MSQQITITNFLKGRVKRSTVLDYIEAKLLEQGQQSFYGKACCYRGPHGLKCGIGHIIPDSKYRKRFDDNDYNDTDIKTLLINWRKLLAGTDKVNVDDVCFLVSIQNAHDNARTSGKGFKDDIRKSFANIRRWYC